MLRRTKIVATLGPASDSEEALEAMVRAGVDVVRINFSHGSQEEHRGRVERVRNAAKKVGRKVGILGDLQGPKIRIAKFKDGSVTLAEGDKFCLDADMDTNAGDDTAVGIDYKELPKDVAPGDNLLLDDGRMVMQVESVDGSKIHCKVTIAGKLSNNKGINKQGGGLSAPALTDKDKNDIITAASIKVDYVAVSFPRCGADIEQARELLLAAGSHAGVVAKIERAEAMDVIDEIIIASDAVMVARGDLGVEIGDAELPWAQKRIIKRARDLNCVVITATQMMESMIENAIPTRAEVFDVANAVLDGTDAVMLSGETAVGVDPANVISAMSRICEGAEMHPRAQTSGHRVNSKFERIDEAVAMSVMYAANHVAAKCIIALTESGATPLWMSRIHSGIPIFALTRHDETAQKLTMYRGVYPIDFDSTEISPEEINVRVAELLKEKQVVNDDDIVIISKGDSAGKLGGTNMLKIYRAGDVPLSADH